LYFVQERVGVFVRFRAPAGKLLHAYTEKSLGKKTLFSIMESTPLLYVYETFREAGYAIRHLDNTSNNEERKDILHWFKHARCYFNISRDFPLVLMSLL
jgi:hypothetical protein